MDSAGAGRSAPVEFREFSDGPLVSIEGMASLDRVLKLEAFVLSSCRLLFR